jgi:homoserine kinase
MKKITVQVPATSANLGPGFDVLGVALHWFNEVSLEADHIQTSAHRPLITLSIDVAGEGADSLPRDDSNLVAKAAYKIFEKSKRWPKSLWIRLHNKIPLSRGMGSSSAAILGGMAAANVLVGKPFKDDALLELAVRMEGHPDNLVPAFAGGFCVSGVINGQVRYLKFNAPTHLRAVVCSPDKPLSTSVARRVLPSRVPLSAAIFTSSRVAFLVGAMLQRRFEWLSFAMEDVLHQPARARLIPGLTEAIREAKRAGAWGCALSGAGSSVIAFSKPGKTAKQVGQAMQKAFTAHRQSSQVLDLSLENKGIRFL